MLYGLFAFAGMAGPARVAGLFRPPFVNSTLFLACFMLTDPPTSPGRQEEQVWIGILAAIVSAVAQLHGVGQTYLLVGILAGNLTLIGRRSAKRWRVALATVALQRLLVPDGVGTPASQRPVMAPSGRPAKPSAPATAPRNPVRRRLP